MDGYINYLTQQFLQYAKDHNIIICPLPTHTSHVLQPLDVGIFQPLKHWHREAIFNAIDSGESRFNKVDFLYAFQAFYNRAFTLKNIKRAWLQSGHIPYNPQLIYDKLGIRPLTPEWTHPDTDLINLIDRELRRTPLLAPYSSPVERTPVNPKELEKVYRRTLNIADIEAIRLDTARMKKASEMTFYYVNAIEQRLSVADLARKAREERSTEKNYIA